MTENSEGHATNALKDLYLEAENHLMRMSMKGRKSKVCPSSQIWASEKDLQGWDEYLLPLHTHNDTLYPHQALPLLHSEHDVRTWSFFLPSHQGI